MEVIHGFPIDDRVGGMTACFCALVLSLLSAVSADLETTRQFTSQGIQEVNPLAVPFVEGKGGRGEAVLGALTGAAYLSLAPRRDGLSQVVLGVATAVHWGMAVRNVRRGSASDVPPIMGPVLMVTW